jgi:hypothetical protein
MTNQLPELQAICNEASDKFALLLRTHCGGGLTAEMYQRFLSMEYHLTRDVQRYFMTAAAHHDMVAYKRLRAFLLKFAAEEELHYVVAANDLREMGLPILDTPFDVALWHSYFKHEVVHRPFVRLGAACVLENLSNPQTRDMQRNLLKAAFLTPRNTKFLVLHMHESLPHGEQILDAMGCENLQPRHLGDLLLGARRGATVYLRAAEWALDKFCLAAWSDSAQPFEIEHEEALRIAEFQMSQLQ